MALPIGLIAGTVGRGLATKAVTTLGNKASAYASNLVSGVKGAAMGEMSGVAAAAGYLKGLGSGSTSINANQPAKSNVIALEQVRQLKQIAQNTLKQNKIGVAADRNQDKRTQRLEKKLDELKDAVEESGDGDGGGGGGLFGTGLSILKTVVTGAVGTVAAAYGLNLARKVFTTPERPNIVARRGRRTSNTAANKKFIGIVPTGSEDVDFGGGSTLEEKQTRPIITSDPTLAKKADQTNKGLANLQKGIKATENAIANPTLGQLQRIKALERKTEVKKTREQELIEKAQSRFLKQFESTSTKAFAKALDEVFPGLKKNVTAATASREGYIGSQVSQAVGLKKGTQKFFEKTFGKEYGSMFAPMFSQLGEAYLDVGGRLLGQMVFGDKLGKEGATTLTGQIIGNVQKGNKQTAAEQLLYGITGIASGPETIFAKYGFKSSKEGMGYIADVLSAGTTAAVKNITGFEGAYPTVRDPRTGGKIGVTGFGDIFGLGRAGPMDPAEKARQEKMQRLQERAITGGEGGAMGNVPALATPDGFPTVPVTILNDETQQTLGSKPVTIADSIEQTAEIAKTEEQHMEDLLYTQEELNSMAGETYKQDANIAKADLTTQQQVGGGIMDTLGAVGTTIMGGLNSVVNAIFGTAGRGGGTSFNLGFGGGGSFGDMLMDMGVSMVANKLTSGIKNPYLKAGANLLATSGIKSIGKTAFGNFTAGTSGGYGSNLMSALGWSGAGGAAEFLANTFTSAGGDVLGNYLNLTGQGGSSLSGTLGSVAQYAPFLPAVFNLAKGDIGGAIGAGIGTAATGAIAAGMGIGGGGMMAALAVPGVGIAAAIVGTLLGGLFGKKKRRPPPQVIERSIMIEGNNNPNAKSTVYAANNPSKDLSDIADALLNVAFNTIKMFEQAGMKLGDETVYYIGMHINQYSNTRLRIFTKPYAGYREGDYHYEYGKPQDTTGQNLNKTAAKIVKDLTDLYKSKNQEKTSEIDQINKLLNRHTIYQLAKGTITQLKLDESVSKGVLAEDAQLNEALSASLQREFNKQKYFTDATVGSKQYVGTVVEETRTVDTGEGSYTEKTGNMLIWDPKQGKYVKLTPELGESLGISSTTEIIPEKRVYDSENEYVIPEKTITTFDTADIVGITSTGIPIYDVDKSGSITRDDYQSLIDKYGFEAVTGQVQNNVATDNSTTVNNYGMSLSNDNDPYRNNAVATRMPLAA